MENNHITKQDFEEFQKKLYEFLNQKFIAIDQKFKTMDNKIDSIAGNVSFINKKMDKTIKREFNEEVLPRIELIEERLGALEK